MKRKSIYALALALLLSACGLGGPAPVRPSTNPIETLLPSASPTATHTPTATPTLAPTLTPTPDPYAGLTIDDLAARSFGGGELTSVRTLGVGGAFSRYQIEYPSDGLKIAGFMNVPAGTGPFPVVIVLHGYVPEAGYDILDYTTRYADALARAGYLVIHPALRGYPPSDAGPNPFRIGFAIDELNLIAIVRAQGGQSGALEAADPARIGLWGHSMGGGITIRTLVLTQDVQAAVLYGSMNADDQKNFERIYDVFSNRARGLPELDTPNADFARISPVGFLERITAAVSIHHGEADQTVPLEWSQDLCARLEGLGKAVECFYYPGQPHTFNGAGDAEFIQRTIEFYDRILK